MKLQAIVFDASTLILLAKVDLLQIVAEQIEIVIPREVREEALAKPHAYDAQLIDRMLKDGRIRVAGDATAGTFKTIRDQFRIGVGEAAALILAKGKGWTLGIDDGPGIRSAKILGIQFVTAIHVLIGLYDQGHISSQSAMAKLDSLDKWGRYHVQIMEDARMKIQKER